ncbi:MAG: hypothetical protein MHM6MM_001150 [Cercozoa sp. M6MM]
MSCFSSARVFESTVVKAPADRVWAVIRGLDMIWTGAVENSHILDGKTENCIPRVHQLTYKDGAVQKYMVTEISDANRSITFELLEADSATVCSTAHTIRLRRVTDDNSTFVEWITDFSLDASSVHIEDSKFKKIEAFAALKNVLESAD